MKVLFQNILKAYSGTCDGLVYYYNPRLDRVLCRRYVIPKATPQNARLSLVSRKLSALAPSADYITDLKYYAALQRERHLSWRNIYMKLMYALKRKYNVDLTLLSKEQIYTQNLPCKSVKQAVEAGLLEPIPGYERLNAEI
jgi:hypothetical protein